MEINYKFLLTNGDRLQVSRENVHEKNKLGSNDSKLFNLARKGKKKFSGKLRILARVTLSSQFHIVPLKSNYHAKFQCCNFF